MFPMSQSADHAIFFVNECQVKSYILALEESQNVAFPFV